MIIVCVGDSFTQGLELWEEKFVPEYVNCKTIKDAHKILYGSNSSIIDKDEVQRDLTYTGTIKRETGLNVINLGLNGSSQLGIYQRALTKLLALRNDHQTEKIICLVQDTSPYRAFLWNEKRGHNDHLVLAGLDTASFIYKTDAYKIKDTYMLYLPDELLISDYYLQGLALQNYCILNNITYLHFSIMNNKGPRNTTSSIVEISMLEESFYDDQYSLQTPMVDRLKTYYENNRCFYLPAYHVNNNSHELIGHWLIEEMQKRGMI